MKTVEEVLLDMVSLCETQNLDYAVMGGLAVRVHGIPRPTYDVDFQLTVDEQRLKDFLTSLEELGYSCYAPYDRGWRDQVGGMPLIKLKTYMVDGQSIDIDVFLSETPFQRSVMERRVRVEFEGKSVWFVTPEDLILFKVLANRPRDLGDVADVLFVQGDLDSSYMVHWANELGISQRFAQILHDNNN